MIKRLRRNFIIVNMAIVTVMLAAILGLVLFFTGSNMERDSVQLLRNASMRPMQHDMRDDAPQKMPPFVFTVYRTPTNEYAAMGNEVIDFSDSDLLSEIFNRAVGAKTETGVLEEYSLRFQISREPMKNAVYFIDISAEKRNHPPAYLYLHFYSGNKLRSISDNKYYSCTLDSKACRNRLGTAEAICCRRFPRA